MTITLEEFPPDYIGPSWRLNENGEYDLPEKTLGWEIAGWCTEYINDPRSPEEDPVPWRFTNEQLRILLWWYAVDDDGNFSFRSGVLQRLKGWGKDPLLAVISLVEFVGPSRFDGWDEDGTPKAKRCDAAWVQVVAVSKPQTETTFELFPRLISKKMEQEYRIKATAELIRGRGGRCRIQAVTRSYRSLEGKRATFVLLNEALWVDTPIPTPGGFVRMGDLEVGDLVYGKDGVPTEVTKVTDIEEGRACLKVSIPNGDFVVASEGHLWTTRVAGSAALPRIRTTLEMIEDGRNFMIPRSGMRHSENIDLPVDPYLLGAWLGDGSTSGCNIAIGEDDIDAMVAELSSRGTVLHEIGARKNGVSRFSFSSRSGFGSEMWTDVARRFRALSCYRDKHIPDEYMVSGHEQRLELLRGLMDTDGHVTKDGTCIFVGTERLSWDVYELTSSLGFLPYRSFAPDSRSRNGGTWRVTFLLEGENPFSIPRKRDRVGVKPRRKWVSIKIEDVPSVPVRCIEVNDEENRLYQAGLSIVTHNTHHWVPGNLGQKMFNTIRSNASKLGNRYLAITNAYLPGEDSVAESMRSSYFEVAEGRAIDVGMMYDSIEAHPKSPLTDEALPVILAAIRGDSDWVTANNVRSEILQTNAHPSRSRRMWYNQISADADALFTEEDWKLLRRDVPRLTKGDRIVLGFDGGQSDDATALVAIRVADGYVEPLLIMERPPDLEFWEVNRAAVDSKVHETFATYDVVAFYADRALWDSYVADWGSLYGHKLKVGGSDRGGNKVVWDMRGAVERVTRANELLISAIKNGTLCHARFQGTASTVQEETMNRLDSTLARHVLNARRKENNYGVSFTKESPDSPLKVDAYAALMLAHEALNNYRQKVSGETQKKPTKVWFL